MNKSSRWSYSIFLNNQMAFETKNRTSFADIISFCSETKSERGIDIVLIAIQQECFVEQHQLLYIFLSSGQEIFC